MAVASRHVQLAWLAFLSFFWKLIVYTIEFLFRSFSIAAAPCHGFLKFISCYVPAGVPWYCKLYCMIRDVCEFVTRLYHGIYEKSTCSQDARCWRDAGEREFWLFAQGRPRKYGYSGRSSRLRLPPVLHVATSNLDNSCTCGFRVC